MATDTELVLNAIQNHPDVILNALTTRKDLLQKLMDPRRDIDDEAGYPKEIDELAYRTMYDRELGSRVVDVYPEETWKVLPRIYEDADEDTETPFEASLAAFEEERHLFHYMQRIDEMSGIGHYGVILWGLNDGLNLDQPVAGSETWPEATGRNDTGKPGNLEVMFIRVFDESLVRIASYNNDATSPRFGQPEFYTLKFADPRVHESKATSVSPDHTEQKVHWSRITHIADNCKTSEILGRPRMQPVWNRLYDLRKVLGGSGEMFWRGGFPGVSLETQPGIENAELDETATRQMMQDYMNGLQRYLALTGMTAKSLAPQIADPTPSFEVQIKAICITIGVPYRVFMGIEEGVVSGDQATRAWNGRLKNRQGRYVTPMIIDRVIQRLVMYGALAPPAEVNGWTTEWPDLDEQGENERAETAVKKTEALARYVGGGVDTLVPPLEFLTRILGIPKEVAEAIIEAAIDHIGLVEDEDETAPGRLAPPPELDPEAKPVAKDEDDEDGDE